MHGLVEFLLRNLVVALPVRAVALLQIVLPLVVVLLVLVVVRVHQLVDAEPHLVAVVQLVRAVVLHRVVVLVGNVVVRVKKLEGNVVKNLKSSFRKHRRVTWRARAQYLRASLLLSVAVRRRSSRRS